jgi:hypothetical protein
MKDRCRACQHPVEWVRTEGGKAMPLNVDRADNGNIVVINGVAHVVHPGEGDRISHFATCEAASRFRKNKARGGRP